MRLPKSLETLADHGVIEEVLRPLMSGKEAQIYLVVAEGQVCAAKIYKDAQNRSFKNRADYVEGRKVRNSRDQRAMSKGSKYGKSKDEDAWKSTEVEMIYRLQAAGVRVPTPHVYIDGVLLMELVQDPDGNPAPRLGDLDFTPQEADEIFHLLLAQVTRMLCAGVVHGDLSDFNVLLAWDGPVIIDFPQSVNAAGNLNARTLLVRDIENLQRFLARFVPGFRRRPYAEEMWSLYENNRLSPDTKLTGQFKRSAGPVDTSSVLSLIDDANRDEARRRENAGENPLAQSARPVRRREVIIEKPAARTPRNGAGNQARSSGARGAGSGGPAHRPRQDFSRPGSQNRGQNNPAPHGRRPGPSTHGRSGGPHAAYQRSDNKNTGPKRGDSVQNSSYVSPEARKTKKIGLTLREGGREESNSRSERTGSDNTRGRGRSREGRPSRGERTPRGERSSSAEPRRRGPSDRQGTGSNRTSPQTVGGARATGSSTIPREAGSNQERDPNARRRNRGARRPSSQDESTPRARNAHGGGAARNPGLSQPESANTGSTTEEGAPRRRRRRRRPSSTTSAE